MKRLLKIAAVLVVLFAVLLGIASVALHILLPPQKAKALVLEQLKQRLHREVQIGDVSIGVLSGLSLADLKISESPTFSKGTFLSSDRFTLKIALLPLLAHKIEVRVLSLKRPTIHVHRYANGKTFNFSDLISSSTTAPSQAAAPATPAPGGSRSSSEPTFGLLVSRADIVDGEVQFVDDSPAHQSADLTDIDLRVRNMSLVSPFSVQASLKAKAKGAELALRAAGEGNLLTGSFKIKAFSMTSGRSSFTAAGVAKALRSSHPAADLQFAIREFDLNAVRPFIAWPAGLQVSGPLTGNGTVKGDDRQMDLMLSLDATNVGIADRPQFEKPVHTPLVVSFRGDLRNLQTMTIRNLGLTLGPLKLNAHGTVEGVTSAQPVANVHVDANLSSVDELAHLAPGALPSTLRLGGSAKVTADVSGTAVSSGIRAKLDATALNASMPNQFSKPAGVPLEVSFIGDIVRPQPAAQTVTFQSLDGTLASLKWTGSGAYRTHARAQQIALNVKTNAFAIQDVAALVPALAPYRPSGRATVNAQVSGSPAAPQVVGTLSLQGVAAKYQQSELAGLNGNASFNGEDVHVPKLSGKLDGSEFSITLTAHDLQRAPNVAVDANFAALDLDKLLPETPATPARSAARPMGFVADAQAAPLPSAALASLPMKLSGRLVVGQIKHSLYNAKNLDAKWNLTDVTPDLSRVSGTATLRQGAGRLQNIQKLVASSKLAKILLEPIAVWQKLDQNPTLKQAHLPSLQSIPFDGIKGDYAFKSGTMNIQIFELLGHDLDIQTQGTVGLAGIQPVNMKAQVRMSEAMVGQDVFDTLRDETGRAKLGFSVTGSVADPQIHVDVADAVKRGLLNQGQKYLQNGGADQIQKALGRFLH